MKTKLWGVAVAVFLAPLGLAMEASAASAPSSQAYAVVAWNDLGMHCYNPDFSDLAVLPPYNNLWAQVIRVADPPQIVTDGVTVEYQIFDNTYSVGKTNFWSYAQQLFGLDRPLPPNVGLTGKGLKGLMDRVPDLSGGHFEATGIPLTEYLDHRPRRPQPFQLASIVVKELGTGRVLASTVAVAPVSSELHCDNCHADTGDATTRYPIKPTGKVDTNILALHDYLNFRQAQPRYDTALLESRPVLCASCHSSNALGLPGRPGISSLSNAMHNHHKDLPDITPDTQGCYNCHPGPKTQCLRDVMSQQFVLNCTTCHGPMEQVAMNPDPWLNEPRCDDARCHGPSYALNAPPPPAQPLYRKSWAHGGVYCEACHDSTHAIAPSRELSDELKFIKLQGMPGTLKKCTACHATRPTDPFRHRPPAPQ